MKATAALALLALAPGCYAHAGAGAVGSRDDSIDGAGFRGMVGAGYYAERARGRVGGGGAVGGVGAGGQRFTLGGAEVFGDVGLGPPSTAGNRWSATGRILAGVVVNPEGEDAADAAQASSAIDLFLGVGLDRPGDTAYGASGPRHDAPFVMMAVGVTATRIGFENGDPIWFLGGAIEIKGGLDLERILDPDDDL